MVLAAIRLVVTLEEPSPAMRAEAAQAGLYRSPLWNRDFPRLQIVPARELLRGGRVAVPRLTLPPYAQAPRARPEPGERQPPLFR